MDGKEKQEAKMTVGRATFIPQLLFASVLHNVLAEVARNLSAPVHFVSY
jgi:hypothetical protein